MPLNTTKLFATTNICHLIEIMSMLGLVWKELDLKKSSLSAEGNGYMVKSEHVPGLGILTRFSRLSRAVYKENRIVPCDEIKRLCFGEVPSLFDLVREKLQVSPDRLDSCLKRLLPKLGNEYRELILGTREGRQDHSYSQVSFQEISILDFRSTLPVKFELIAMLAKSVHIPGSRFRRLPRYLVPRSGHGCLLGCICQQYK
jgi:hypothetical protein